MAEIPAQTAYLNLTEKHPVRQDWVVGTTGEPLLNYIKYLQEGAGKMCSLNRNGYFKPGPHLRRRRARSAQLGDRDHRSKYGSA